MTGHMRAVSFALAALVMGEATAHAQQRLAWDYDATALRLVQYFSVVWDGVGNTVGLPIVKSSSPPAGEVTFSTALPALAAGQHTVRIDPCNASGCSIGTETTFHCSAAGCVFGDAPPTTTAASTEAVAPSIPPSPPAPAAPPKPAEPAAKQRAAAPVPKPEPSPAQAGAESPDATKIEDAGGVIVDARGDRWGLMGASKVKSVTRNGQGVGGDGIQLIYKKHVVYLFTGSWYYRWDGMQMVSFGPNPP